MTVTSYIRGHKVYYDEKDKEWKYCDEKLKNSDKIAEVCPRCCQPHLSFDCDFCLRSLQYCKFIVSACCGHGVEQGYIQLKDGRIFKEVWLDE